MQKRDILYLAVHKVASVRSLYWSLLLRRNFITGLEAIRYFARI